MEKRAQGALEYLIMVGVALIIVAVVIGLVLPSIARQKCENAIRQADSLCASKYFTSSDCDGANSTINIRDKTLTCVWDLDRGCVLDSQDYQKVPGCESFY